MTNVQVFVVDYLERAEKHGESTLSGNSKIH